MFHCPSGKLHLVNDASLRLLTELLVEPLGTRDVIAALVGPDATPEQVEQIVSLLVRFDDLGLITTI